MANDLAANLYQPVSQRRQRPVVDGVQQREDAQEVAEVVSERMQLQPHGVVGELTTGYRVLSIGGVNRRTGPIPTNYTIR